MDKQEVDDAIDYAKQVNKVSPQQSVFWALIAGVKALLLIAYILGQLEMSIRQN